MTQGGTDKDKEGQTRTRDMEGRNNLVMTKGGTDKDKKVQTRKSETDKDKEGCNNLVMTEAEMPTFTSRK